MVDALADTHLNYQAWRTRAVERVGQRGLQYGGSIVYPYEICAKVLSTVTSPVNGYLFTIRAYPIVYEGSLMARIFNNGQCSIKS